MTAHSAQVLLMPGLDGTGDMFEPFLEAAPAGYDLRALSYPTDTAFTYAELADWVAARLPTHPISLVAESFSGPVALLVAQRRSNVAALVLCATFVRSPYPAVLARAPRAFFRKRPAAAIARHILTGGDVRLARAAISALSTVQPDVVASRIQNILTLDCRDALLEFDKPLLYLSPTKERLLPSGATRTIRELRPDAAFREIDGPHLLLQCKPRECWAEIAPFLARARLVGSV
jgi:pimeloyl-ACP methyl ester carboxylesterase